MFKKISTSYNLVKIAFSYIKKDGELLLYSILSLLSSLAILATFAGIGYNYGLFETLQNNSNAGDNTSQILFYISLFIYYLVFSFITFYFNTAIITSVQRRIEGKDNKFGDGLKSANKHLKEIFIWSIINATITTILKIIQNRFPEDSIIGKIIVGLIGGLWNILTFFAFPLMIINKIGPKEAIKESANLFKKTWGERAIISVGIGLMFFFIYLLFILLSIGIIFSGMWLTGIIILIIGIMFIAILSGTSDTIIKTILLNYAQNGTLPDGLSENQKKVFENIAIQKQL